MKRGVSATLKLRFRCQFWQFDDFSFGDKTSKLRSRATIFYTVGRGMIIVPVWRLLYIYSYTYTPPSFVRGIGFNNLVGVPPWS